MTVMVREDLCGADGLLRASREVKSIRHSQRILAIRDILLGEMRKNVCRRYGVGRENLRHWVEWYNEGGVAALADENRSGAPRKLKSEMVDAFKQRIEKQPDIKQDGFVRWRAVDIKKVLRDEFGTEYKSLSGVRKLCHHLGFSFITSRPRHPKQNPELIAEFKKNFPRSSKKSGRKTRRKK